MDKEKLDAHFDNLNRIAEKSFDAIVHPKLVEFVAYEEISVPLSVVQEWRQWAQWAKDHNK